MRQSGDRATANPRSGSRRAVILDRDGVLVVPRFDNGRSYAPRHVSELQFFPGVTADVETLKEAGFVVIVATNQPDVGAGIVERNMVESMHQRLRGEIPVDDIEVCYDTRAQASERRKPAPGMLHDAARKWSVDLSASYLVGDRASDIEAGIRAGCTCVFIDLGYTAEDKPSQQHATVGSLREAVTWILAQETVRNGSVTCPQLS